MKQKPLEVLKIKQNGKVIATFVCEFGHRKKHKPTLTKCEPITVKSHKQKSRSKRK